MIVDTSALGAILFDEPERPLFVARLISSERTLLSAGSWIELTVVLSRRGVADLVTITDRLLEAFSIRIAPVDAVQGEIARKAYLTFGRGTGHSAKLNFGDCFSYALAIATDEPLLFKGKDFRATDVRKWDDQRR